MTRDYNFEKVVDYKYCKIDKKTKKLVLLPNAPEEIKEAYKRWKENEEYWIKQGIYK